MGPGRNPRRPVFSVKVRVFSIATYCVYVYEPVFEEFARFPSHCCHNKKKSAAILTVIFGCISICLNYIQYCCYKILNVIYQIVNDFGKHPSRSVMLETNSLFCLVLSQSLNFQCKLKTIKKYFYTSFLALFVCLTLINSYYC